MPLTKMRKLLLFLSFLLCFNSSFSQDKKKKLTKFSEETSVFLEQMDEFINSKKNKDLSRVFSQFEDNIQSQKFDTKTTKQIIVIANTTASSNLNTENPDWLYVFEQNDSGFNKRVKD